MGSCWVRDFITPFSLSRVARTRARPPAGYRSGQLDCGVTAGARAIPPNQSEQSHE